MRSSVAKRIQVETSEEVRNFARNYANALVQTHEPLDKKEMDHRISTLISALENHGWSFMGPADVKSDWWFQEIYTLTSVWAPREVNLYITLLIDPQDDKYKEVWAIGFSTQIPSQHSTTWLMQPSLKDLGRIDITAFIKELNALALIKYGSDDRIAGES